MKDLITRLRRLPVGVDALGIESELMLLQDSFERKSPDTYLYELISNRIAEFESSLTSLPFLEPQITAGLHLGEYPILSTPENQPVTISFQKGQPNYVTHLLVAGQSGSGKSCLQAVIASQAAQNCHTVLIDSSHTFRDIHEIQRTHNFIRMSDLRLNPWDVPEGVIPAQVDQIMNREICESYGLKFAEYEMTEIVKHLREKEGTPNLKLIIDTLKSKNFKGFTKRGQYRDSALLVLGNLLNATGDLFLCREGMNLRDLLSGNVVIELDGLPEHQSFITRYYFQCLQLLSLSQKRLSKPLLFILDEGQVLSKQEGFAEKILQLRHHGIHLLMNFQNISLAPTELIGNSDVIIGFQSTDGRDREVFARSTNLKPEQRELQGFLDPGECICFLPHSGWKHAFCGIVPRLEFQSVSSDDIARKSKAFASRFPWKPVLDPPFSPQPVQRAKTDAKSGVTRAANKVASDAVGMSRSNGRDQVVGGHESRHRASSSPHDYVKSLLSIWLNLDNPFLTQGELFERAGIKSGSRQAKIKKVCIREKLIEENKIQVGKTYMSIWIPEEKAYREVGIAKPKLKSKGGYLHSFLVHRIWVWGKAKGYAAEIESKLSNGKLVDVVLRSEDRAIFYEIAVSPPLEKEISNYIQDFDVETQPDYLVAAVLDKPSKMTIETLIAEEKRLDLVRDRIVVRLVGEYMKIP